MTRSFEYIAGISAKFWEIAVNNLDCTVRFGKIGTQGQSLTKTFFDPAAALRHAEKLITEKLSKGYVELAVK